VCRVDDQRAGAGLEQLCDRLPQRGDQCRDICELAALDASIEPREDVGRRLDAYVRRQ